MLSCSIEDGLAPHAGYQKFIDAWANHLVGDLAAQISSVVRMMQDLAAADEAVDASAASALGD